VHDDGKRFFDFFGERPSPEDVPRPEPDEGDPELQERVLEAMKTVRDPEIPVNLVDLGLIYDLVVRKDGTIYIEMTYRPAPSPALFRARSRKR
jgi:hypothetical protein